MIWRICLVFLFVYGVGSVNYSYPINRISLNIYTSNNVPRAEDCLVAPTRCILSPYRQFDGTCNNLQNPALGAAMTSFIRLLPAKYGDGLHKERQSVTGGQLPNPRKISLELFDNADISDVEYTVLNMQWGQVVTHDLTKRYPRIKNSKDLSLCCENDENVVYKQTSDDCLPIKIPYGDYDYEKRQQSCFTFLRSQTDEICYGNSNNKPAEQLNSVSHYLDLSLIYGSTNAQNVQLRTFRQGLLRSAFRKNEEWLQSGNQSDCYGKTIESICYASGDNRVNDNIGITLLQTIFLREHNRIARNLANFNPHWMDEKIFQEARKINIAKYQFITYYEWLPNMLGFERMIRNKLIYKYQDRKYISDYDRNIDPSQTNSFSQAAFRSFHSQIQGTLMLASERRYRLGSIKIDNWYVNPTILEVNDNFESLLRGLSVQAQHYNDESVHDAVRLNNLRGNHTQGSDLIAVDIQRGRDHGLASYNDYRAKCGLPRVKSWQDLLDVIEMKKIQKLKRIYKSYNDIDLFVGGIYEEKLQNAQVGPTFACILIDQFYRTRVGDRFFFENEEKTARFNKIQLENVRKSTMSELICNNEPRISKIQRWSFKLISKKNPLVFCADIPKVNIKAWQEYS